MTKKRRYWKTAVKGSHILYITKKKHIRDLKVSGSIGGAGQRRGGIGVTTVSLCRTWTHADYGILGKDCLEGGTVKEKL